VVLHLENTHKATIIYSSKIFKFQPNKIIKGGINNNQIILHLQRLNIKNSSRIHKYNSQIYLRVQAAHNKKQEDSFLILIKVLIGTIKI